MKLYVHAVLVMGLCGAVFTLVAQDSTVSTATLFDQKQNLELRLDSLEMEKKLLLHTGQSITALEAYTKAIQDSVAQIRATLLQDGSLIKIKSEVDTVEAGAKAVSGTSVVLLTRFKSLIAQIRSLPKMIPAIMPRTLFDWIVVGVAAAAVISAIVLVVGLFNLRSLRGSKKVRKNDREAPQEVLKEAAPQESDDWKKLETLRKRITEQRSADQSHSNEEVFPVRLSTPVKPQPIAADDTDSTRQQVIDAAREGLDANAIARQLQISVDQVRLIINVAKKS